MKKRQSTGCSGLMGLRFRMLVMDSSPENHMRKITILLFCIMLLITLLNCATFSYSQNATVESESKFVGTRAAIGEGNLDCAEGCTDTPPTEEER